MFKIRSSAGRKPRRMFEIVYADGSRAHIPDHVRALVYARDGHACASCGSTENLSLDHIKPWSKGGSDDESNLQTLCTPCNSSKGARI